MGHRDSSPEIEPNGSAAATNAFHSIRDRFPLKRKSSPSSSTDRQSASRLRPMQHTRFNRKALWFWVKGGGGGGGRKSRWVMYLAIISAVFLFAMGSMVMMQSYSVGGGRFSRLLFSRSNERERLLLLSSKLRFVQPERFVVDDREGRVTGSSRIGIRSPRLAIILGKMRKDPQSLMLFTVMKNLKRLGYILKIYSLEDGQASSLWEQIGGQLTILDAEMYSGIDWSIYEGVILSSLEAGEVITSLMQEPFCSVPVVWIIQEDDLANRLPVYEEMGWKQLISYWRSSFSRANVVVFPDFSLPMLYSVLDTGNFFVIPGSPVDVWAAETYSKTHSKDQIREDNGFSEDDVLVLVVGSTFFYNELSWDYAVAMQTIGPLLTKYARRKDAREAFKFVFLCGNTTDGYNDDLQEVASRLGLPQGSIRHYGMNVDVNSVLFMADIVLYGSFQDEQGFPPLLVRAMTFGIPFVAPDTPVMRKYATDGVHGMFFPKHNSDALMKAFSLLVSDGKLSRFGRAIASSGKLLAKNMLTSESIRSYAKLLENVLIFPSDALFPEPVSHLNAGTWEWNLFTMEMEYGAVNMQSIDDNSIPMRENSLVYALEEDLTNLFDLGNVSENQTNMLYEDVPTELDWVAMMEIESSEEYERVETEELKERMEIDPGNWEDIYRNARKSEKLRFEANERDEGELERTGQPICIYEIYSGSGAWPLLHHGSLYRGLSLSTKAQRLRSDDVNAVARLPLLNDTYYRDILCELGGMFSIARKVDNIHKRPWIGFQSWRAAGRKVSLSTEAEKVLEEKIKEETHGDRIYFWVRLDMDNGVVGSNDRLTFWSMCDILNGGHCRDAFEDAFRRMYGLPPNIEALPPMPEDGGHWSALHSWVMPTPSFVEFIMFSRMFVDSLHASQTNSSKSANCLLASSESEKKHCYCRVLELLINVWAYHSARKMVYINPRTGSLQEQHSIDQRVGYMWAKYFNTTLLKSMDEDLAEAADDNDYPSETWLWPSTGEVHWQGIYEREREERYRFKMDKKRKTREKLYERMKHGYQQKSLGG